MKSTTLTGLSVPPYRAPAGRPLNILIIGAHPDDGEVKAAGTAALWADRGHRVNIVSMTDGRRGHHRIPPDELVKVRAEEAAASAKLLGADHKVLPIPDGELMPTLEAREQVVRLMRSWRADVVLTHRPNDYHPDHRYTSILVQDASFLVTVPHYAPDEPRLERLPVCLFLQDNFRQPSPFEPDVVVDIDPVADRKLDSFLAMPSQFLEWLPWNAGVADPIPADEAGRRAFVENWYLARDAGVADQYRDDLIRSYGETRGRAVRRAEAFQLSEFGSRPSPEELRKLFPV